VWTTSGSRSSHGSETEFLGATTRYLLSMLCAASLVGHRISPDIIVWKPIGQDSARYLDMNRLGEAIVLRRL